MRYLLLALAALSVLGCGGSEPISATASPLGCWRANGGELDLMADGNWRQFFDVSPTTDAGTWTYDAGQRELTLLIVNASSSSGPAVTNWKVVDLTAAEMWTDNGSVTRWQSVACRN